MTPGLTGLDIPRGTDAGGVRVPPAGLGLGHDSRIMLYHERGKKRLIPVGLDIFALSEEM